LIKQKFLLRVKKNKPLIGNWGYVGGYLGPAAYSFSWQWFHNNKTEPNIGKNDDWLFKCPFRKGKYTLNGFNFNVKDHSLLIDSDKKKGSKYTYQTFKIDGFYRQMLRCLWFTNKP